MNTKSGRRKFEKGLAFAIVLVIMAFVSAECASAATGGPDHFGYTFIDSNAPDGPTYDWIEISGTGTDVLPDSDDSRVENINLGFFFNYYGTDYSQLAISNNGLLFSGVGTWQYVNQPITQTPGVHGFVAPFWDDIVTWGAGTIYYQTIGTAPNRMFVVEWHNNQHYYSSTSGVTFEAILYEGSNNIKFQYKDVDFGTVSGSTSRDLPPYNNGGSATVGIEGPTGDIGLQYSFNEQVIDPGLAILFKYPQFAGTNLYLTKQAPASKDRGSTMTYTLHYHNFGDTEAQLVELEDTLPAEVEFVSALDGGNYDSILGTVRWWIGNVAPLDHDYRTVTVRIPQSVPIGTVIQNDASISTSTLEVRYDDNEAHAETRVTGSSLPPGVGVEPNNGGIGTPSIYWHNPITFSYHSSDTATGVDIRIHVNDGGPDITGSMAGGPPDWTYTTTFYPRHGRATVTYTVNDPAPYSVNFDVRNMRGFENTITAEEIEEYIRSRRPNSPMLDEAGIGQRFIDDGIANNVNPAFLVATAEHESQFGTQGWAASHPEAHNSMGWGIPAGDTPPNAINSADSWGDMVERVARRIAADDGYYYGQGLYTVDQIRNTYAAEPATATVVGYINALAESAGQAGEFDEDFNIYIDPAGYIYDADNGERIAGATVWLQRPDGEGGWENVLTGEVPPISQPDENPLITGEDGQYQWDVLEGSYRVHVEALGYYPADSIVVSIPPPVTDLHVGLTRIPIPPVADAGGPYTGYVGEPIIFDGTGSYDLGGTIISYEWDLDDDGEFDDATGPTPSEIWNAPYSGTISLRVTDDDGEIDIDETTLTVEEAVDTQPTIESVTLDAYTTIPDASIHVTVEATDNVGVTSVTADSVSLDETEGVWEGDVTAPSATGDYTLTIRAEDATENFDETTVDYSVVIPTGGLGVAILPKISSASAGSTLPLDIKIVSTENFDDVLHIYLTLDGIPPDYQADLGWFDWIDTTVQVSADGEIILPITVDIPGGTSLGYKSFGAKVESTKWSSEAQDYGSISVA